MTSPDLINAALEKGQHAWWAVSVMLADWAEEIGDDALVEECRDGTISLAVRGARSRLRILRSAAVAKVRKLDNALSYETANCLSRLSSDDLKRSDVKSALAQPSIKQGLARRLIAGRFPVRNPPEPDPVEDIRNALRRIYSSPRWAMDVITRRLEAVAEKRGISVADAGREVMAAVAAEHTGIANRLNDTVTFDGNTMTVSVRSVSEAMPGVRIDITVTL